MIDIRIGARLQLGRLLLRLLYRSIEALRIDHAQVTHDTQPLQFVIHRWAPALQITA